MNIQLKTKLSILAIVAASYAPISSADTIGLYVGSGQWNLDYSGTISQGADSIDLVADLGLSEESQNSFYAAFEHPIPGLPNIKVQRQDANQTVSSTLTRSFDYGGTTFALNDTVNTSLDLGHTDLIFYYEILDNWVSLDLGVNVKYFDGNINLSTSTDSVSDELDDYVPMLYGRAQFEIPATNFSIDFETSILTTGSDSLSDIKAAVAYETDIGLGAELGFKRINLEVDDLSDIAADLSFEGYYFNVSFHF